MSDAILAALFLNFVPVIATIIINKSQQDWSALTHKMASLIVNTGKLALPLSIFLFVWDEGILRGLWHWMASAALLMLVAFPLMDAIRSALCIVAVPVGFYFAVLTLIPYL
jgi:hypothetical protein